MRSAAAAPDALGLAEALGRRGALAGLSLEVLLAAYRVGARAAWDHQSRAALAARLDPGVLAEMASRVFTVVDELSGASVRGFQSALDEPLRARRRRRAVLGALLEAGAPQTRLDEAAGAAGWRPPERLRALLVPPERLSGTVTALSQETLELEADVHAAGSPAGPARYSVLFVPDAGGDLLRARRALHEAEEGGEPAVLGPAVPWWRAGESLRLARRLVELLTDTSRVRPRPALDGLGLRFTGGGRALSALGVRPDAALLEVDDHLPHLLLAADPVLDAALVQRHLGPLLSQRPETRIRLVQTLASWLSHQGAREAVARELIVHPQTVRYRLQQVRDLLGDSVDDPAQHLALLMACHVALSLEPSSS